MEDAGGWLIAETTLQSLPVAWELSALDEGRLLAQRARIAITMGDVELAQERLELLERIATKRDIPELRIRAWIGYAAISQVRGNYPEVKSWSQRVLEAAEARGFPLLKASGHQGLMICSAENGDFASAIVHAWNRYQLISGDPTAVGWTLEGLGRILLLAGHHVPAQTAFLNSLATKPPRRVGLPAVGGLALAASRLGDRHTVRRVAREVAARGMEPSLPHETAHALLECATALHVIGDTEEAKASNALAIHLAREHGYHEVVYRADTLAAETDALRQQVPTDLSPAAFAVVESIEQMDRPDMTELLVVYAHDDA
jgi:tetratricopeptide (TPR) repeat protein